MSDLDLDEIVRLWNDYEDISPLPLVAEIRRLRDRIDAAVEICDGITPDTSTDWRPPLVVLNEIRAALTRGPS